jgi:uncharacterized protein (TIGR03084 family)
MQQASDFLEESQILARCLEAAPDRIFATKTQFKSWTVDDILGHLHFFNAAAEAALAGADAFDAMMAPAMERFSSGGKILDLQFPWLGDLQGRALFDAWQQGAARVAEAYEAADPKARVKWLGPEMSALSSITARQMETWSHGQAIFDLLGETRHESDRIRNIAHLGVATFGWSFRVWGQDVPEPAPYVELTAPSGAIWSWNAPQEANRVTGSAVEFAQIVAQTRNWKDTAVKVNSEVAQRWMQQAQCFAGPPNSPPAPGTRFCAPS